MKKPYSITCVVLILFSGLTLAQKDDVKEKCIPCEKLTDLKLPDVTISEASEIKAKTSHCRVMGIIGKEIKFELLLPDDWNGIYIMGGGGGFVGTIQNASRSSVNEGYATSGTDTGHEGRGNSSANWALDNMERQLNFGHLAVHRTAEVSKSIISAYYGESPKFSYFTGCSRGGGQAMMEAQRYPEDFDGIVAGAPAFNWTAFAAEFVQNTLAVYPSSLSEGIISREQLHILQDAINRQCDFLDGIQDSIINNPGKCRFNFDSLPRCPGDLLGRDCFTSAQVEAIRTIYKGLDIGNGITYPGFPPGAENKPGSWYFWITGSGENTAKSGYPSYQAYFGIEIFKYLILQNPDWDYRTYDFKGYDKELKYASAYLDAISTDYSGLRDRKGKMIIWHGWNDPALSAYSTIEHYKKVIVGDPSVKDYMRLYLLPGVLHCGGGDGPSQTDWIAMIRDWVEKGIPPEKVILSRYGKGKNVMERPVFPYPDEAVYDGKGDPNAETSFVRIEN